MEIEEIRNRLDLTQAKFATIMQVTPKTVYRWEKGLSSIKKSQQQELKRAIENCLAANCDRDDILEATKSPGSSATQALFALAYGNGSTPGQAITAPCPYCQIDITRSTSLIEAFNCKGCGRHLLTCSCGGWFRTPSGSNWWHCDSCDLNIRHPMINAAVTRRFRAIFSQLKAAYEAGEDSSSHSKGRDREHFTQLFLERTLPSNIPMGSGEIVDIFGDQPSPQMDVVLQWPWVSRLGLLSETQTTLFPCEAVAAVLEVKTEITNKEWTLIEASAAKLRKMKPMEHHKRRAFNSPSSSILPSNYIPFIVVGFRGPSEDELIKKFKATPIDAILQLNIEASPPDDRRVVDAVTSSIDTFIGDLPNKALKQREAPGLSETVRKALNPFNLFNECRAVLVANYPQASEPSVFKGASALALLTIHINQYIQSWRPGFGLNLANYVQ